MSKDAVTAGKAAAPTRHDRTAAHPPHGPIRRMEPCPGASPHAVRLYSWSDSCPDRFSASWAAGLPKCGPGSTPSGASCSISFLLILLIIVLVAMFSGGEPTCKDKTSWCSRWTAALVEQAADSASRSSPRPAGQRQSRWPGRLRDVCRDRRAPAMTARSGASSFQLDWFQGLTCPPARGGPPPCRPPGSA